MGTILSTENIIKQYRQYDHVVTAVNRVNFSVEDNEFVAIIGSSGSGKSTFLHICAGLDFADSGTVNIRGNDITKMDENALSRFRGEYIGFVFQQHQLIEGFTALENILIPAVMCGREDFKYSEHIKKLIDILEISDRLHHLPSELSGGQQQKIAIARAMINRPQILLADEPTGNLDRRSADNVLDLLINTKTSFKQTLVIVTHDLEIASRADKVYKMENGELFRHRM